MNAAAHMPVEDVQTAVSPEAVAEVLAQVLDDTEPPPVQTPSPGERKAMRTFFVALVVRPWEVDYPFEARRTICYQRKELEAANRALRARAQEVKQLRHELRLRDRVMKLRAEERLEERTRQLDAALALRDSQKGG